MGIKIHFYYSTFSLGSPLFSLLKVLIEFLSSELFSFELGRHLVPRNDLGKSQSYPLAIWGLILLMFR